MNKTWCMRWLSPAVGKRPWPGRKPFYRPAVSLLEAALSLIVIGLVVTQGMGMVTDFTASRALQAEARMLTAIADDYASLVGRRLPPAITMGRVTSYTPPSHIGLMTPFGREIRLAHFTPSSGELVVMAYTWSAHRQTNRKPTPRHDSHIRQIGYVAGTNDRCTQNHICGFAMDWNASALLTALGNDGPGEEDLVALRWLTMDRNTYPYLHRAQITGHPNLNRLETDLNMGDHAIVGLNTLRGARLLVTDQLELAGELAVTDIEIGGNLAIGGNLTTTGTLTVGSMEATADATIGTLKVDERLLFDAATIGTDFMINDVQVTTDVEKTGTGDVEVTGTIHANEAEVDELTVTGNLHGAVLDYEGRATTLSRVRTRDMIINELTVGTCTNC